MCKIFDQTFHKENRQMAKKYIKRCSTLVDKEMQTETTMRHHHTPIRLPETKKTDHAR